MNRNDSTVTAMLVDRLHPRMCGVSRYMLGLASHPDPVASGVDLRVLHHGRQRRAADWQRDFGAGARPWPLATRCDHRILGPAIRRVTRAEVVHYPFHYLPDNWMLGTSQKIVTVHGASAFSADLQDPDRGNRIRRSFHLALDQLRAVVTVSEWSKDEIVRHFQIPREIIRVIPHGVDSKVFRPRGPGDVPSINVPYLLHVGPAVRRKNLLTLVRAFAMLAKEHRVRQHLVLAGAAGQETGALAREVERLGVASRVHFVGPVDEASLVNLYQFADAFVFPSFYEGFGLPVIEAMACGTPVLTSACSALPEVGGTAAAYFDPKDVESVAASCLAVIEDPVERASMSERGTAQASRFSWQTCSEAHLTLYKQVADAGTNDSSRRPL